MNRMARRERSTLAQKQGVRPGRGILTTDGPERQSRSQKETGRNRTQRPQRRNDITSSLCVLCVPLRQKSSWNYVFLRFSGTDDTDSFCANSIPSAAQMENSESVKSVKSVVQFLWLRLAALGFLRLFAAISSYSILRTPLLTRRPPRKKQFDHGWHG